MCSHCTKNEVQVMEIRDFFYNKTKMYSNMCIKTNSLTLQYII